MTRYTLYYFNGRGRAEICRMLFAAAGVQFTDRRFEFDEWHQHRKDMPSYSVPVLEIDQKHRVPETMAIARYLAREFDFYGRAHSEMLRNDYICDCLYEVLHSYMRYFHAKNGRFYSYVDPTTPPEMIPQMGETIQYGHAELEHIYKTALLRVLPFLERTLALHSVGKTFFLGDKLMLCDMMCYSFLEGPYMDNKSLFSKYPLIVALRKRVSTDPLIESYLNSRCNTSW